MRGHGLLRGAYHRARIRATRWLAMTDKPSDYLRAAEPPRGARPARTKSIIWSSDGPGLVAHWAIICGWKNRIIAVQAHIAASGTSGASNSPDAAPSAMTAAMVSVIT